MHIPRLSCLAAIAVSAIFAQIAAAYEVVQFLAPSSPSITTISVFNDQAWGQTFTTNSSGYVTQLQLQISRSAATVLPLQLELRKSAALPDMTISGLLYSTSIPAAAVPASPAGTFTTTVNLLATIPAAAGDKFAILLSSASVERYHWTSDANNYPGGTALWKPFSSSYSVQSGTDSGFAALVSDVPEPAGLSAIALGFALLSRRRR